MPQITLDPINKGAAVTLSNDNLTASVTGANNTVRASKGKSTGKWYWEVKLDSGSGYPLVGIVNNNASVVVDSNKTQDVRYYWAKNMKFPEMIAYGAEFTFSDIIGVSLDLDIGTIEFYKNGVSQGISHTNISTMGEVFPAFTISSSTSTFVGTANFGGTTFAYPIPTGYDAYGLIPTVNKLLLSSSDGKVRSIEKGGYTENLIPKMTSNDSPSGKVSSGSTLNNDEAWKAFDGVIGNNNGVGQRFTYIGATGWIQYEFPKPQKINKYTLSSFYGATATSGTKVQEPKNWTFEGSNDGVTYDVLDTRTNQTGWRDITSSETREYEFTNNKSYKMYRLNVSANNGDTRFMSFNLITMIGMTSDVIVKIPSQSEQNFINHGISQSDLSSVDMYADLTEKYYIQDVSTVLGDGKVFEHVLDVNKVLKKISIK